MLKHIQVCDVAKAVNNGLKIFVCSFAGAKTIINDCV